MRIVIFIIFTVLSLNASALSIVECWDGKCLAKGWTRRIVGSDLYTDFMCRDEDCAAKGWIAGGSEGISIYTQCMNRGCFKDGWYEVERLTPKLLWTVQCRKGNCLKNGWDSYGPEGTSYTECSANDCAHKGWVTNLPGFKHTIISCQSQDCFRQGWIESPN